MVVDGVGIHCVKQLHHLLAQPDILVRVHRLRTSLAGRGDKRQPLRRRGPDQGRGWLPLATTAGLGRGIAHGVHVDRDRWGEECRRAGRKEVAPFSVSKAAILGCVDRP